MIFVTDKGPANVAALAEFESKLGQLPSDYRDFISIHNGVELIGTASLRGSDRWPVYTIEGIQATDFWDEDYPKGSMPIGSDGTGNTYLMGLEGDARGHIYFFDHEQSEVEKPVGSLVCVAESFAEFLGRIQDFDPEDPEDTKLFHIIQERRHLAEEQRQSILNPKKPWWKIW